MLQDVVNFFWGKIWGSFRSIYPNVFITSTAWFSRGCCIRNCRFTMAVVFECRINSFRRRSNSCGGRCAKMNLLWFSCLVHPGVICLVLADLNSTLLKTLDYFPAQEHELLVANEDLRQKVCGRFCNQFLFSFVINVSAIIVEYFDCSRR